MSRHHSLRHRVTPTLSDLEQRVVLSPFTISLANSTLAIANTDPTLDIDVERVDWERVKVQVERDDVTLFEQEFPLNQISAIELRGVGDFDMDRVTIPVRLPEGSFGTLQGTGVQAQVVDRVLNVIGTPGRDRIDLKTIGNLIEVEVKQGGGWNSQVIFGRAGIDRVVVDGRGGNDDVDVKRGFPLPVQRQTGITPPSFNPAPAPPVTPLPVAARPPQVDFDDDFITPIGQTVTLGRDVTVVR